MALIFDRNDTNNHQQHRRPITYNSVSDVAWPSPLVQSRPSTDDVGLSLVLAMSERSLLESAAQVAGELFDAVEPGTTLTLPTGTVYHFDEVFGILFRDDAPLNAGRFGIGPAGPFDDITLVQAGRTDVLAFFAELPTVIDQLRMESIDILNGGE